MTKPKPYQNWNDYFKNKFEGSGKYKRIEEGLYGDTFREKYIPIDKNDQTEIRIGYLDEKLIYWKFENPITAGFNKQQEIEYFYRFDFTPGESYGTPGLDFIDLNLNAIDKQLSEGLKGKEIQYFRNGEHIKSEISIYYYGQKETFPQTIYLQKKGFIRKLLDLFTKTNTESFQTNEIDLHDIFRGI